MSRNKQREREREIDIEESRSRKENRIGGTYRNDAKEKQKAGAGSRNRK